MNICITGANGQLGRSFRDQTTTFPTWNFHFADRRLVDLTDVKTINRWLSTTEPAVVINCAAYTHVNQAEQEPQLARQINVEAVKHLARYCKARNIPLLHYSSDYVYHTEQGVPYRETDPTAPKGIYAATKLEGEQEAMAIHPLTTTIRTSWVYAPYGHNFVKTMLRLGREKEELSVVCDQIGTPTYARDLTRASLQMLSQWAGGELAPTQLSGIFNFSNEGVCSWYDFAVAIFELSNIHCRVKPVPSEAFPSPVERPHFSVLDKRKIKNTFQLEIPYWRDALGDCLRKLEGGQPS